MRRALSIGIDDYPFGPLQGCVADAKRMAAVLATHEDGTPNFECRQLIAPQGGREAVATRAELKRAVTRLFRDRADVALLHFSGHGTENNLGGYLVTQDVESYDEGVAMADVLQLANASPCSEVVILLDCCHSGHLGNMPAVDNEKSMLRDGVSVLTASRSDQASVEVGGGGLFTSLVIDALEGGAADLLGEVSVPAVYAAVEAALGAWDQRPLFKANVSRVVALRHCRPPIARATLRELPALFPVPAEDFALSPAFETTCQDRDEAKMEIFCKLQELSRVHLVVPVGERHMYDAAMNSKACRLTASGRYYWRLARSGRL